MKQAEKRLNRRGGQELDARASSFTFFNVQLNLYLCVHVCVLCMHAYVHTPTYQVVHLLKNIYLGMFLGVNLPACIHGCIPSHDCAPVNSWFKSLSQFSVLK